MVSSGTLKLIDKRKIKLNYKNGYAYILTFNISEFYPSFYIENPKIMKKVAKLRVGQKYNIGFAGFPDVDKIVEFEKQEETKKERRERIGYICEKI